MSSDSAFDRLCTTCRGAIRLEERAAMLNSASAESVARAERLLAEARWFMAALPKVRGCSIHHEVIERIGRLAERLSVCEASVGGQDG
jgi:hypothetical protein